MSLITRCPACETMFKVVPDQLRISEGWARCGQCGEIFDASQALITDAPPDDAPTGGLRAPDTPPTVDSSNELTSRPSAAGAAAAAVAPIASPTADSDLQVGSGPEGGVAQSDPSQATVLVSPPPEPAVAAAVAQPDSRPDASAEPAAPPATNEPSWIEHVAVEAALAAPPAFVVPPPDAAVPFADSTSGFPATKAEGDQVADSPEVSFLAEADRPSMWRKPAVRIFLWLLLLLLVAALAAQFLLHERDRIAAMAPASRPALAALCVVARCEIAPLRQIDAIVIDSSSFNRVRGENYRLAFSLKNNAVLDVAMPTLELALTDGQDQPVVRRVIAPDEFGAPSRLLPARGDWSGALSLHVRSAPNAERIAGYRLLAFYP